MALKGCCVCANVQFDDWCIEKHVIIMSFSISTKAYQHTDFPTKDRFVQCDDIIRSKQV